MNLMVDRRRIATQKTPFGSVVKVAMKICVYFEIAFQIRSGKNKNKFSLIPDISGNTRNFKTF